MNAKIKKREEVLSLRFIVRVSLVDVAVESCKTWARRRLDHGAEWNIAAQFAFKGSTARKCFENFSDAVCLTVRIDHNFFFLSADVSAYFYCLATWNDHCELEKTSKQRLRATRREMKWFSGGICWCETKPNKWMKNETSDNLRNEFQTFGERNLRADWINGLNDIHLSLPNSRGGEKPKTKISFRCKLCKYRSTLFMSIMTRCEKG